MDTVTSTVYGVSTEGVHQGFSQLHLGLSLVEKKWLGITTVGTRVFAAPYSAPVLLVMDTETEEVFGLAHDSMASYAASWLTITGFGSQVTGSACACNYYSAYPAQKT